MSLFPTAEIYHLLALGPILLAPFIGSFMGVLVERLPRGQAVVFSRSICPGCHAPLKFYDLVPVISWVLLRGKCRQCKEEIGLKPLLYEIGAILIALWVFLQLPPDLYWIGCLLGWCLLALAITDYSFFTLPNILNYFLLVSGLSVILFLNQSSFLDHLAAAICGYLIFYLISRIYHAVRKRDGIGAGDFKLFAGAGAWVGWAGLPSVLLIACCSAVLVLLMRMAIGAKFSASDKIPLGSHLCLGIWLVWLYGPLYFGGWAA